jgi:hypothetical protein
MPSHKPRHMPDSMDEWQTAARKEVAKDQRAAELRTLSGPRRNQLSRDNHAYQNTGQRGHANRTANTSRWTLMLPISLHLSRNLLTKSEPNTEPRDGALGAEPKATWLATAQRTPTRRTSRTNKTLTFGKFQPARLTTPVTTPTSSPASSIPPPPPPKLSYAQQIRVLEAKMSDEERSLYLDARDMGEDFCSAGL